MQRLAGVAKMPDRIEASPRRLAPFPWTRGGPSSPQAPPPRASVQDEPSQPTLAPAPIRVLASFQRGMVEPAPRIAEPLDLDETLPVHAAPLHTPALPFSRGTSAPPKSLPVAPSEAFGDTVGVQGEARCPTLPFESRQLDLLRLERYAELVAALRTSPECAETILCASGLKGADERRSIHAIWVRRFDASPELRLRLEALVSAKIGGK